MDRRLRLGPRGRDTARGSGQAAEARGITVHHGWAHALDASRGAYDLVLLLYSLEHCDSPAEEMAAVRKLLRAGGRAVILTPNADSTIGSLFRGRHWTGYDFPRHQCLFGPRALRQLAERSGFLIERLGSRDHAGRGQASAENLLRDWGAPGWLTSTAPGFFAVGRPGLLRGLENAARNPGVRARSGVPETGCDMSREQGHVAVVGAGLAGLLAARELRRRGISVTVYEAGRQVAGLARSFTDSDGFTYDFGAHFITNRLAAALGIGPSVGTSTTTARVSSSMDGSTATRSD